MTLTTAPDTLIQAAADALTRLTTGPDTGAGLDRWAENVARLSRGAAARLADAETAGNPQAPDAALPRAQALTTALNAVAVMACEPPDPGVRLDRETYMASVVTLGAMLEAVAGESGPTPSPVGDAIHSGDVALSDGRTLRVAVDPDGGLILAVGDGHGRAWREDVSQGVSLPPGAPVGLVAALGRLHRMD